MDAEYEAWIDGYLAGAYGWLGSDGSIEPERSHAESAYRDRYLTAPAEPVRPSPPPYRIRSMSWSGQLIDPVIVVFDGDTTAVDLRIGDTVRAVFPDAFPDNGRPGPGYLLMPAALADPEKP